MHGDVLAELLCNFLQAEASGFGEEEVDYYSTNISQTQCFFLGRIVDGRTWQEDDRPADDDEVVFPADVVEADGCCLEEDDCCWVCLLGWGLV